MDDIERDRLQEAEEQQPDHRPPSLKHLLSRRKVRILRYLLIYFIAALAWIFFSDRLLFYLSRNSPYIEVYSLIKGFLFVVLSCIPFYLMLAQRHTVWQEAADELESRESEAYRSVFFDPLTQLPNSRYLEAEFSRRIFSDNPGRAKAALIYFDIDELRHINEQGGFQQGNELLQFTARFLREQIRDTDLVVRLAFDEFVILAYPLTGSNVQIDHMLTKYMERLWRAYQQRWSSGGRSYYLSASIGASLYPDHGDTYTVLLQKSEAAMTACKMTHKNDYCLYSNELKLSKGRRTEQLVLLRKAIESDQMALHYQPQYDLKTGALRGLEALIRWNDPERGLIYPGAFIPLAETSGLMPLIDSWVIDHVQKQRRIWREENTCPGVIAINVSSHRFNTSDLEKQFEALLAEQDRCQYQIEIEITETAMLEDQNQAIAIMRRLHEKGIQFALDDFGSGYASLNYLRDLPLDLVKIDQQFVQSIVTDQYDTLIVQTIINLSHQLGFKVIAEGIETEEQMRALQALDCDFGQGYYLGRPAPPEQLTDLLQAKQKQI